MSGHSDSTECYKCGSQMNRYMECGFAFITEPYQLTLEEVNEMRADNELKPLKKLAKQE